MGIHCSKTKKKKNKLKYEENVSLIAFDDNSFDLYDIKAPKQLSKNRMISSASFNSKKKKTDSNTIKKQKTKLIHTVDEVLFKNYSFSSFYTQITDYYDVCKTLIGKGHFGTVRKMSFKNEPSFLFAVKTFSKSNLTTNRQIELLETEINILSKLDHQNLVRFFEFHQDENYVHFVMEFLGGGDLISYLFSDKKGILEEKEAAFIMKQLLQAVEYLHLHGICHRDLKPENFIFSNESKTHIKIIDFGLSKEFSNPLKKFNSMVGTPNYVAPEIILGYDYNFKCDMWSLGCILYLLLCGYPPFSAKSDPEVFDAVKKGVISFDGKKWGLISKEAKNLILKLLDSKAEDRINANEALNHIWFKKIEFLSEINNEMRKVKESALEFLGKRKNIVLKNNKEYNCNFLKNFVYNFAIWFLKENEIDEIKNLFCFFDKESLGMITILSITDLLQKLDFPLIPEIEINNFLKNILIILNEHIPEDAELYITYRQFQIFYSLEHGFINDKVLKIVFQYLDDENSGFLNENNIKRALIKQRRNLNENNINNIIAVNDKDKDGKIGWDDFIEIMKNQEREREGSMSMNDIYETSSPINLTHSMKKYQFK